MIEMASLLDADFFFSFFSYPTRFGEPNGYALRSPVIVSIKFINLEFDYVGVHGIYIQKPVIFSWS